MNQSEIVERARRVKTRYETNILELANVVGLGVGLKETDGQLTDQIAIIVNVSQKKAPDRLARRDLVPPELEGVPTDVQEVGSLKALL